MYCEECGDVMMWRCTDNITEVSKFKCPNCGHIQTGKLEKVEPKPPREPNYCFSYKGKWIVKKTINHQEIYVGCFADEKTAKLVVDGMKKVDWKKDLIPSVFESLGIHKVKRSWVCA